MRTYKSHATPQSIYLPNCTAPLSPSLKLRKQTLYIFDPTSQFELHLTWVNPRLQGEEFLKLAIVAGTYLTFQLKILELD